MRNFEKIAELVNKYFYNPKIESLEKQIVITKVTIKKIIKELREVEVDLKYARLTKKAGEFKIKIKETKKAIKEITKTIKRYAEKKKKREIKERIRLKEKYEKNHYTSKEINDILKYGKIIWWGNNGRRKQ